MGPADTGAKQAVSMHEETSGLASIEQLPRTRAKPLLEFSPRARLRLYTRGGDYARVVSETATGRWRQGHGVAQLERDLASRVGVPHALAMPMARVGIYFAVRALIRPGQKVILSPYTISDVVNMVICAGGVPVFADLDAKTCNISAAEVEKLIDDDTGAVLVTHFYGCMCDVDAIQEVCKRRNLPMIEDAAQAFGAKLRERAAGTIGDIGVFSFGLYKNVTSFYGGMLVTDRKDVHDKIAAMIGPAPLMDASVLLKKVVLGAIADFITWPPVFSLIFARVLRLCLLRDIDTVNEKLKIDVNPAKKTQLPPEYFRQMSPLQARLVAGQLERVDAHVDARIAAARQYHEGLHDLGGLLLPPLRLDRSHTYWYYAIQYPDRDELVKFAMRSGRDLTASYHRNCADLPCFSDYFGDCPVARKVAHSVLYLPTYPGYPASEVKKNIATIRRFFGK